MQPDRHGDKYGFMTLRDNDQSILSFLQVTIFYPSKKKYWAITRYYYPDFIPFSDTLFFECTNNNYCPKKQMKNTVG